MIISRKFKFAFIHNPKVAGTSIRHSIEKYHDYPQRFWHQAWSSEAERTVDTAHIPFPDLPAEVKATLSSCFTFGFVRNPINRFWAGLAEFRRQHADWPVSKLSADELLLTWLTPANVRHDWRFTHFCPQHYFFYEGNKRRADYIGRHESFEADWTRIQQLVGIKFDQLNNSRHRVALGDELLSAEAYTAFMRLYARDYVVFGYDTLAGDTNCGGQPLMHHERVDFIHKPGLTIDDVVMATMTMGERVAYLERQVNHYRSCLTILENRLGVDAYQASGDQ